MNDNTTKKSSYTGLGLVFGAAIGLAVWQLLFPDQIALGFGIGMATGLIIGAIGDSLGRLPMNILVAMPLGGLLGGLLSLGIAMVYPAWDQSSWNLFVLGGIALGLVLGAVLETRQDSS